MKTAVIIMNLGTPVAANKKAVRAFLKEFLSDRRVVEVPRIIWMLILHLIILTFRTRKVTRAYQKIWQNNESPLRTITRLQADKLRDQLNQNRNKNNFLEVCYAMTYSGPSLQQRVTELEAQGVEHIVLLPLYPQYSATTTGSIYDQLAAITKANRNIPQIHVIKQYYNHPLYIDALAKTVQQQWQRSGKADKLLMSFHGIPQVYVDAGDPYYQQCLSTAGQLADKLSLPQQQWSISFQSRLGFSKWLSPYTSETLKLWGQQKINHVDVICPAFSADCLETLEEISYENKDWFIEAGGKVFNLIPCLNDQQPHIEMMAAIIENYMPAESKI